MIKDLLSIFFEIIFFCFKFSSNINANPWLEKDWRGKVDKYFEYITKKRDSYKDWFMTDNKKKK